MRTRISNPRWWLIAGLLAVGLPATARAQDATLRVYEATFNEMASKLTPMRLTGRYTFQLCSWLGCMTVCDSGWVVEVTNIRFGISPAPVAVTGDVSASWCGLGFGGRLATNGDVAYSSNQNAVRVTVGHTSVQPCFNILGNNICLPTWIDVAPALSLPSIPLGVGSFGFETTGGPRTLHLQPSNLSLSKKAGYVELRTDLTLL